MDIDYTSEHTEAYYATQDVDANMRPTPSWSIYREVYANPGDSDPIEGATEHVSTCVTEKEAKDEVQRLNNAR